MVEVNKVALRVQDDTTEDAMSPVLIDRFAVRYISESCTSAKYLLSKYVVKVMRSANAPPYKESAIQGHLCLFGHRMLTQTNYNAIAGALTKDREELTAAHFVDSFYPDSNFGLGQEVLIG